MFDYGFMQHAFMAATLVALVAGVFGYFLVLRGQIFAGHALAHVGFPGATGAALLGVSPLLGLLGFTAIAGLCISRLERREVPDVAIGVVLAGSLGLGLLFLHLYPANAGAATALLFGNVLGIAGHTIVELAVLSGLALGLLAAIGRPLVFATLQPALAEARGVHVGWVSALFMLTTAVAVAETIQIVGILLVFTLMIAPAGAAVRLTTTVAAGIAVSMLLALISAWSGLVLAFYTDAPVSFWITLISSGLYLAALLLGPRARPAAARG
ncbi:metal ABC transporter permease [Salinisphaera sp. Q1T1-3]|uniref:metal ABC transporter permease n=1 Tax=Salinisphaera sp. Q1T1-3 TaxID=2321229 RepID=UPI000E75F2E3|nr:metal ABC transporter permease [Salinisphaera sp. Q1T1-3]